MQKYTVAILIPTTSNNRPQWQTIEDTYLYKISLKTFLRTMNPEHKYIFYIGIDPGDRIFANPKQIIKLKEVYKHVEFKFIRFQNIQKGHLTKMWNILFKLAYNDGCDYFFQCGDDINFKTQGWINAGIIALQKNNNIGITGPCTQNPDILTQVMVSRKHMEIFGWFFPEEIINWFCDNWYCYVYKPNHFFPLLKHHCINEGGEERYLVANNAELTNRKGQRNYDKFKQTMDILQKNTVELANKHKKLIEEYLLTN